LVLLTMVQQNPFDPSPLTRVFFLLSKTCRCFMNSFINLIG
jgi:hypothetical protein